MPSRGWSAEDPGSAGGAPDCIPRGWPSRGDRGRGGERPPSPTEQGRKACPSHSDGAVVATGPGGHPLAGVRSYTPMIVPAWHGLCDPDPHPAVPRKRDDVDERSLTMLEFGVDSDAIDRAPTVLEPDGAWDDDEILDQALRLIGTILHPPRRR